MNTTTLFRRGLLLLLIAAVAFGAMQFIRADKDNPDDRESKLEARLAQYCELRLKDDWVNLYEMLHPTHQQIMPLNRYLQFFGHGAMKTVALRPVHWQVREDQQTALVQLDYVGELVIAKLPPSARNLRLSDPDELKKEDTFEMGWVWHEGDWYFQLDRELVTGEKDGKAVSPVSDG